MKLKFSGERTYFQNDNRNRKIDIKKMDDG